jgi:23S rRNA-/tRNA-specific pseudouridylate synthase
LNPKDYFYLIESTSPEIHQVPEKVAPTRLADYAIGIFSHYPTKSSLKKAIKKKSITVDGETVTTAQIINGGEKLNVHLRKTLKKRRFS